MNIPSSIASRNGVYASAIINGVKRFFILALTVVTATLTVTTSSQALIVSPIVSDVVIAPGDSQSTKVALFNDEGYTAEVTASIMDVRFTKEGVPQLVSSDAISNSITSWFDIADIEFVLAPNDSVEMTTVITVPEDATSGGRYAAVVLSAKNHDTDQPLRGSQVAVESQIAHIVYLTVSGELVEQTEVDSFGTDKLVYTSLPASFSLTLHNTGNVHTVPRGEVTVTNELTGKAYNGILINTDSQYIVPDESKEFTVIWEPNDAERSLFEFGKFTSIASVKTDTGVVQSDPVSFWVVPPSPLIVIFLVIVILLVGVGKVLIFIYRSTQTTRG